MIYQDTKRYLKTHYKQVTLDFQWTPLNNIQFLAYIESRYSKDEITKNISELKQAFKDFFESTGKLMFRFKEGAGIKIKILPYSVEPENSKHLKKIVKIIQTNQQAIEYPYQDQNDQIVISGKIRREVNREVADTEESVNVKELIKYAIRVALQLSDKDIITQLKRKYLIKIFDKNEFLDIENEVAPPEKREGKANRFNGYTAEQIEETYKEIFQKGDVNIKYFLKSAMKHVFSDELDFKEIDNQFYESKSLKIIHKFIAKELSDYIELENDYILGLTGYIMRKHFIAIHELMAIELIECIHDKNKNATDFLLYYNGKTILIDNKKFVIPSLETEDGRQWNSSSLIGICNLWMNTKRRKESYEHRLVDTDMKLQEINGKLAYIKPEKEAQEKILKESQEQYEKANQIHEELESKLSYLESTSLNSNEYFKLQKEVQKSAGELHHIKVIMNEANSNLRAIKDANMKTFTELEFYTSQKKQLIQDVKAQNLNVDSKNAQIDPIIKSIVTVLMDRTKLMD